MSLYKINIDNRNYASWTIFDAATLEPVPLDIQCNPSQHKFFTGDVFTFN